VEAVLAEYARADTDGCPLICMDEAAPEVLADAFDPIPVAPGATRKEDYQYTRLGVRSLFLFVRPFAGWRRVGVREHRTMVDWAAEVRELLTVDFPRARKVRLVCDNLNTHHRASLYAAFGAAEALGLADRLELVFTPAHGSWLNMAELELSVLSRQCLDRRFADLDHFGSEVRAWAAQRNAARCRIEWRFRPADAREKLRHLYPTPQRDSLV
jgi:DDE superfamily endonuclease